MSETSPIHVLAKALHERLSDSVLGFLALLSLFLLIAPGVFEIEGSLEFGLISVEYLIIGLFALEYFASFLIAPDKADFISDRWRLLDALIIVTSLLAFMPYSPDALRNAPAIRLLRLGRLALLGTRSSVALRAGSVADDSTGPATIAELKILSLGASGLKFEAISWEDGLGRIRSAEPDWLFISGVTESRLEPVADALGVPVNALQSLFLSTVPRFGTLERFSTFFVRHPLPMQPGQRLVRTPVLLVGSSDNVVVLSRGESDLEHRVEARLATLDEAMPRMVRATLALVGEIMQAYTDVMSGLEFSLQTIEGNQSQQDDDGFLASTFALRADILKVRSSLKHLRSAIRDIANGKVTIAGAGSQEREPFRFLADDANDLYEEIDDLRESLQGLVDLRLNVSSFQMNRVMRLLALLTALALIPATLGGLLGMNLTDAPWPGTLAQVSFGVAAGMALSLYIFAIKGWMR